MPDRSDLLSFEELQIAVDQLDQAVEVMSHIVKRIKRGLQGLEDDRRTSGEAGSAMEEAAPCNNWLDGSLH